MSFKTCALKAGITSEDMAEIRQHIQRAGNDAQGVQDYLDGLDADLNDLRNQTGTQPITETVETPGEAIAGPIVDMIKGLKPEVLNQAQDGVLGSPYKTGVGAELFFAKNTESAKGMAPAGMDFGQDIEPAGEYMVVSESTLGEKPKGTWNYGTISFKNPIVLEHKNTRSTGWKKDLSDMFGGKKGKSLTSAIKKAGHDGVLTVEPYRDGYGLSEAVNISGVREQGSIVLNQAQVDTTAKADTFKESEVKDERIDGTEATQDLQESRDQEEKSKRRSLRKSSQQRFRDDASREFGEDVQNPRSTKPGYYQVTRAGNREVGDSHFTTEAAGSTSGTADSALGVWAASKESSAAAYGDTLRDYIFHYENPAAIDASVWAEIKPNTVEEAIKFREGLIEDGHDAIIITGHDQYNHHVVLKPESVVKTSDSRLSENFVDMGALPLAEVIFNQDQAQDTAKSILSLWRESGIEGSISETEKTITIDKIVVPEGERGAGLGSAAMNQLIRYANQTGKAIALTPSKDYGAKSLPKLKKFYKNLGFVENKGKNKDFEISESMYRPFDGSKALLQKGETDPRGQIALFEDSSIIKLYEAANLSTFLHESGHLFLSMTGKLYNHANATPELKADGDAILKFLGAESFDTITVDQHEKWARAQEKYFGQGKAPSIELQSSFRRFSQWIKQIYKSLVNLNVELPDDIRQVMDRMLASDEQIDRLKGNFKPLFESAEDANMTEAEFKAYDGNASPEAAKEELFKKLVKEIRRQETKWWKDEKADIQSQITKELEKTPVYSAKKHLAGEEVIPGSETEQQFKELEASVNDLKKSNDTLLAMAAKAGGLNRDSFAAEGVDPEHFKTKGGVFGKPLFPKEGGITADTVAERYNEENNTDISANDAVDLINDALAEDFFVNPDIEAKHQDILAEIDELSMSTEGVGSNKILKSEVKSVIPGRIPRGLYGMVSDSGTNSEVLAAQFGFPSGEEMITQLAESKTLKKQSSELADMEMMARHGDALNDGRIEEQAELAMRNDSRAKKLLAELRSLSRKTGGNVIDRESMREYARTTIGKMKIRSIYPSQYRAAEIRSARLAAVAKSKGDIEGAQKAKTQEIINFYLGKEAALAKDKAEKIRSSHKAIQTKKYDPKKYNNDPYVNTAKLLIRVFDYRKLSKQEESTNKLELENARLWIESQQVDDPEKASPYLAQAEILGRLIPYKDMTLEDIQGLNDTVLSLMKGARETSEQQNELRKKEMERLGDSIVKNRIEEYKTEVDNDTPYVKTKQLFDGVSASLRKLDSFARQSDAFIEQGPVWKATIKPLLDASRKALTMRNTAGDDLKKIFHDYQGVFGHTLAGDLARDAAAKAGAPVGDGNKKTFVFESGKMQRMSYGSRVAVALNMGNEGNYEAMTQMTSMPLTDRDINSIVATLSEKDWDLVQNIWDYIDTYWPMAAELEKSRSGAAPIKVQAKSFTTPGGREMKGGYYPLSGDPTEDTKLGDMDTQAAKFINGGSVSKATKTGSLIERTKFGGKKINFSINVVFNHIDEVIHDVSHWQAVHDVSRVLNNHRVNGELTKSIGPAGITAMQQRLKEIAAGPQRIDALTWWERPLRYARLGVTYSALGYSVSTSLKNIAGLTTAVPEVGTKQLASSVAEWASNPIKAGEFVTSKSEYMIERSQVINRDIAQIRASLRTDGVIDTIKDYSFWFMTQTDKLTTQPIWMAAYEKGQSMFETEEEAIDFADQTVRRTQGSGDTMDLSNAETRSELMKTMTIMYSAMNAIYGIAAEQRLRHKARGIEGAGSITTMQLFSNMMWLTVAPGLLMAIISNRADDDEPEEIAGNILGEIAGQTLGLVPVARDIYSLTRYGSSFPTPVVDVFSSPAELLTQLSQGEMDKGLLRATTGLMPLFHIPGGSQLNRTMGYLIDMQDNEIDSFSPWELIVTGKE